MPTPNEIRDLVEQDRFELMMRCPFYGRIICSVELVVVSDPQVRMACTDYRRIFISGDAYSALPEEMRLAVLAHEVLHIALRHAFRIGDRDKNRFEKAADIEVHYILTENFPDPYGIDGDKYGDWSYLTAEQIYELLPPSEDKTKSKSDHCSPNDPSGDGQPSGNDDEKKKSKSSKKKSGKNSTGDNSSDGDDDGGGSGDGDGDGSGFGDGASGNGDGTSGNGDGGSGNGDGTSGDGCSSGNKQDVFSDFRPQFDSETEMNCIALSSGMMMDMKMSGLDFGEGIGSAPGSLERLFGKLNAPRVNWQVLLRQFIRLCRGGAYSWMRPNRKFISRGLYLPGRQTKSFSGILALDTSGSTTETMPQFVAELTGLLRSFGKYDLTIIECDAMIQQIWTVSSNESMPDLTQHKFEGGGGTDFAPVFDYIRDHHLAPNVLIFFTDGQGPCSENKPPYPVLWMLTQGGVAPVPWGKVVYYEEN